ncbi:non-ribosomal peptide synthetase [Amycolatopsis orientalis]|uniref:non-ribosomal peptide synthetase n=1 Tax=Amycolatopsis orientalis TaxID=31958 RepID=UPI000A4F0FFB|nr:non-ribosomal peptide synthetase [Amycolatopsis orientalis]
MTVNRSHLRPGRISPRDLPQLLAGLLDLSGETIGEHENLIELGLDSITMMRLAGAWRKAGASVTFADLVATPTLAAWSALLAVDTGQTTRAEAEIDETAPFALALMQHAYWVGRAPGQRVGGVDAHFYHEFDGAEVDPQRLENAVRAVFARHTMLRVAVLDDGTQRVLDETPWPGLRVHPWTDQSTLDARRTSLSHRRMDVASGEVFDVQLSLLPEGRTRVHVNLDMIAADALSLRVLLADLSRAYAGETLPPLSYSYPRYLAERGHDGKETARDHWAARLPTLPGAPRLPVAESDGEPTVVRRHRRLGPSMVRAVERSARRHGLTTAMALAAVFAETLTAWSAEPRFLLNLPLFDREPLHDEVDSLVGDFTSSVLLEWDGAAPGHFADRASLLQQRFHADVAHTAYSGVEVLRDLSRLHGEQILAPVVYTSALGLGELFAPEVTGAFGEPAWIISQGPQVWLDAQVTELDGGLLVNWDVREDVFPPGVPDAMFAAYCALLDRLIEDEAAWSEPVDLVPRAHLLVRAEVNDTTVVRRPRTLHDSFFAHAAACPDAPALFAEEGSTTYGELAARALRVAGHLIAKGAGRGHLVAVSLPQGPDQVAAVLGVLAAGAAYLPLGVDQPVARRERILETAGVSLVLDDLEPVEWIRPLSEPVCGNASALAYVIYTSGSTGEPKGVEITHAAAVNTVDALNHRFGMAADDRTLALSSVDFDLSVYDLFGPLSAGGAVVCVRDSGRRDASAWVGLLTWYRATVLNCAPALLDMVLTVADGPLPLRVVLLGGDKIPVDLPRRLAKYAPDCRFAGLGGTTETAIHSTVCEVDVVDPQWTCVPYGMPLDNVRCRVVDPLGRDRPDRVPGELWIGGAGVARGYRGDPLRTKEKFVEFAGTRWYRTGDRVRYTPEGCLEFLGRDDHQVKIRGHRVELGEVEAALIAHPSVTAAAVVLTTGGRLAAAVTGTADPSSLKDFLIDRLPMPMRPEVVAVLPSLPLTPNGKIDRALLSRTLDDHHDGERMSITAPVGEVERSVAAVWSEVLQGREVGREHDFFALGGDSLLATRLIGKLRTAGLSGVSLSDLFARPVLADFAAGLTLSSVDGACFALVADPAKRYEPFPPTEVQRAYWLGRDEGFTLGGVGCHFYREYDVDDLDLPRLEAAVNRLVRRHEMLRAVFDERGDQRVLPEVPWFRVELIDGGFDELRDTTSHTVFDPAEWPLFTVRAARSGRRTRLAIGMDNLVLDALSILIFYAELASLYENPDLELPAIGVSFRDYVLGVERAGTAEAEAYWSRLLPDLPPAPRLPLAKDPAEVTAPRFERRFARVEPARWRVIVDRAREHGLTPSAVLLTAFAEVLGRWSARTELTLNITLFDRKEVHPDIDRVLGDFTSLLLVAYRPGPDGGWLDRVRQVQEELWGALDHRDVSAVWVLRELARAGGDPDTTMPVVFTSALGVSADPPEDSTLFADNVWGVSQTPQVWLDHQVTEVDGGVHLNWDAVEELFPPGLLDDMFEAYVSLVDRLAVIPWQEPVPDLLPSRQREVRAAVNATAGPVPEGALHSEFFRLAAESPDRVAVVGALTYGELADRALRLAALLGTRGVKPGDTVAISLPKGPDQLVAVFGVLAAGCTYVPIGIDQPPARRDRVLALAGTCLVVTAELLTTRADPLPACLPPADLAYVIFTSGSTGEPKGVETTHRAALNTIADINERFAVGPEDRVLAVSALDFDLSVYDIFGPLSVGGAVVTIEEDDRRDAHRWRELVTAHGVTIWNTVPALLDMLLTATSEALPLRVVLVSGDWVGLDLPGRLAASAPDCRFIALGGATEAAIWSNWFEVGRIDPAWTSIPYGTPLRNQRFRVVDDLGRDCPDWVTGELWIGGDGVAEGYRGAPELTAARFVDDRRGERWYRTGDLGRSWPDGTLEFLGRADQQVKIRGHRVELGEIEAALESAPGVRRAAAAVTAERRLVAAVVTSAPGDRIRSHVATLLPAHMLPERVAEVASLPLTANGKVDRAAIATLARPGDHDDSPAPTGAVEMAIGQIWAGVLHLDHVGRDRNFFSLGGDSLRATRLIAELRTMLGVTPTFSALFAAPTVEGVARAVSAQVTLDAEMEERMV